MTLDDLIKELQEYQKQGYGQFGVYAYEECWFDIQKVNIFLDEDGDICISFN